MHAVNSFRFPGRYPPSAVDFPALRSFPPHQSSALECAGGSGIFRSHSPQPQVQSSVSPITWPISSRRLAQYTPSSESRDPPSCLETPSYRLFSCGDEYLSMNRLCVLSSYRSSARSPPTCTVLASSLASPRYWHRCRPCSSWSRTSACSRPRTSCTRRRTGSQRAPLARRGCRRAP